MVIFIVHRTLLGTAGAAAPELLNAPADATAMAMATDDLLGKRMASSLFFDRGEDEVARKTFGAQREALVQKALGERIKELNKPKDADKKDDGAKPDATPPRHQHRARELAPLYSSGADKHTCSDH